MQKLSKSDAPHTTQNEKTMNQDDFIVSKTDTKGYITYCNQIFIDMSGYTKKELIGANHNLIRHPDMPAVAFKLAWDLIKSGKEFFGFVKNLKRDGGYYWVFAYITADYDQEGKIIGYSSFRRKPPQTAIDTIIPVYGLLVDAEKKGGIEASGKLLGDFLAQHKTTYNDLVINLQKG
ncbi:MAG: PAS domain S-box-containing protein [Sulfurimonas sp.]|jgi:PAS domain S-box-containing protein|uniref:PAS domain-containing protein n=1 Tax=Sulfurimonas sp. TaxID=2022749 RepID=UPI0039E515D2